MNKSESKYFHTAARMDRAFLELLEKKDFAYITVKEICQNAGVNRSTFYLHYETIADLLSESVDYLNAQFQNYMKTDSRAVVARLHDCPLDELNFITPEYLVPYLNFAKDHRRLFRTAIENAGTLRLDETYDRLFRHVFTPILERLGVADRDRKYIMTFYIRGLVAIITEWLMQDCPESVDHIISVMQQCVLWRQQAGEGTGKPETV